MLDKICFRLKKKEMALAWIKLICGQKAKGPINEQSSAKKKRKNRKEAASNDDLRGDFEILDTKRVSGPDKSRLNQVVSEFLSKPNEMTLTLLPLILRLRTPTLSGEEVKSLRTIVEIYLGENKGGKLSSQEFESLSSQPPRTLEMALNGSENGGEESDVEMNVDSDWAKATDTDWSELPLGKCPASNDQCLFGSEIDRVEENVESPNIDLKLDDDQAVKKLDWSRLLSGSNRSSNGSRDSSAVQPDTPSKSPFMGQVMKRRSDKGSESTSAFYRNDGRKKRW